MQEDHHLASLRPSQVKAERHNIRTSVCRAYLGKAQHKLLMMGFLVEVPETLVHWENLGFGLNQEADWFLDALDDKIHSDRQEDTHICVNTT